MRSELLGTTQSRGHHRPQKRWVIVERAVVPGHRDRDAFARSVPELGVGAVPVAPVSPEVDSPGGALREPEAIAEPERARTEPRHLLERPRGQDPPAEQAICPAR